MTRLERAALSETLGALVRHDAHLWWELKRQIFDWGYSTAYPRQFEYETPAKGLLLNLSNEWKEILHQEWPKWNHRYTDRNDSSLISIYLPLVIEEIVRRATVAANRTENW